MLVILSFIVAIRPIATNVISFTLALFGHNDRQTYV
jgi:hypothetical protein